MTSNVILCCDGSVYSEYAFDWYCDNFYREGHKAILLHIPESYFNATMMSPGKLLECQRETEEKTKALREKYTKKATDRNICAEFLRQECKDNEKPGETVIRIAKELDPIFIVTGTRGLGTIRRTILGSVSDYIVHHSHCPVLVARHKEHHKEQQQSKN